ncbi:hypothetical protein BN7_3080 [Wickerhamomyces ciferrii]|uniref:VPS9 domain-containing protein n=1 Tax=Wickerhamomyces ciferrii (strain ATCC 14091 / BCRC 22168 / CBS 111 / JCM 3599 / NBRC 0793 / NRRL Y-1031 F-60-10) TaxID=1206466 RepID=K0KQ08_WICCF|nr:uncharacterized protein BN7_3080 [Wickerhamomyces ciferrii]CCH43529.1 hypothetical protein BN7_3080 [Wickerhamomyces ciferrii]
MARNLPLLQNPLLNAIFNNSHPFKSLVKDVNQNNSQESDNGVIILVPDSNILNNYIDRESGIRYNELCLQESFVRDHIITTNEERNAKLFTTLSKKEILIKKELVFTGKGFKSSLRLKVLTTDYFFNFNDYFEKGRRFMIMFIESPLVGVPELYNVLEVTLISSCGGVDRAMIHNINEPSSQVVGKQEENLTLHESNNDGIKFEHVLRNFPLIARSIGEKYEILFKKFNVKSAPDTDSLIQIFTETMNLSSHIFKTLHPDHVNAILEEAPNVDFNECLYNYVEFNLFDKIWYRLCELNGDFLLEHFTDLNNLSINQVNLPKQFCHNIELQSILEKKIAQAVSEFKKLELSVTAEMKAHIFINTISLLSNIDGITIDADTLVGLLLMVVVHSKVQNLESHLFYVQNFSFQNIDLGLIGYSLSTIEGVLYYLKDIENMKLLKKYSLSNSNVISFVETKELISLKNLADDYDSRPDSSLKCRTLNGDSLLALAILSNDYDTWKLLIDYEEIFTIEDILTDTTIADVNLLNLALNSENYEITNDLVDILLSSCTNEEIITYLNAKDSHNRSIGHYLFHYKDLIPKIGAFINWIDKDLNGQTPLFSVCRSYDTPEYSKMIREVFEVVDNWYTQNNSVFDYEDHIDNRGNTLLHILSSDIDVLLKYSRINLNESNKKSYTPLMIYAKYNRIENIQKIIDDNRTEIVKSDRNNFNALDLSKNEIVSDLLDEKVFQAEALHYKETKVGAVRIRLENGQWKIIIRVQRDKNRSVVIRNFNDIRNLIELVNIEYPNSFIPIDYYKRCFNAQLNFPAYNKLKLNILVDQVNTFLGSLILNRSLLESELLWDFLSPNYFDYQKLQEKAHKNLLNFRKSILELSTNKELDSSNDNFLLQPEEISEINHFLKFSTGEINKLRATYDKLLKIVNFNRAKYSDLQQTISGFSRYKILAIEELSYVGQTLIDAERESKLDDALSDMVLNLYLTANQIVKRSEYLTNAKIYKWWRLYGELIELNNSYKKFKAVEHRKSNNTSTSNGLNGALNGVVEVNEESFQNLTLNTEFVANKAKDSPNKKQTPSFLTNFIESKRTKHEQKLLSSIKEVKENLMILNRDIKFNHETLAMEMNNFLIFKTKYLEHVIKKYTKKQIRSQKFKTQMLQRSLDDLKSIK